MTYESKKNIHRGKKKWLKIWNKSWFPWQRYIFSVRWKSKIKKLRLHFQAASNDCWKIEKKNRDFPVRVIIELSFWHTRTNSKYWKTRRLSETDYHTRKLVRHFYWLCTVVSFSAARLNIYIYKCIKFFLFDSPENSRVLSLGYGYSKYQACNTEKHGEYVKIEVFGKKKKRSFRVRNTRARVFVKR